jgi:hypothetical protein
MKEVLAYKYWILAGLIVIILISAWVVSLQRGNSIGSVQTSSSSTNLASEQSSSISSEQKPTTELGENKATRLGQNLNPIDEGRQISLDTFKIALDGVFQDGPTTIVYLTIKNTSTTSQTFASILQTDVQNDASLNAINNQNASVDYDYLSKNFVDFQLDVAIPAGEQVSGAIPYRVTNKSRMYIVFNDSNLERSKEYFLVKE